MIKTLIKEYLKIRLNSIDKEIEDIVQELTEQEANAEVKGKVAQINFQYEKSSLEKIKKLQRRVTLYETVFKDIKDVK